MTDTITKLTKLVVSLVPLIAALGSLAVAVNATIGVSDNTTQATVSYRALADRVNQLSVDVAFLKGQSAARSNRRPRSEIFILSDMMLSDSSTDSGAAVLKLLPSNLAHLMIQNAETTDIGAK